MRRQFSDDLAQLQIDQIEYFTTRNEYAIDLRFRKLTVTASALSFSKQNHILYRVCHGLYVYTDFGVKSSSCFPFTTRTDGRTDRQTYRQTDILTVTDATDHPTDVRNYQHEISVPPV